MKTHAMIDAGRRRVESFDLADVRLLAGPFRNASLRNADWLFSLEPDRFLSWFRKEAGLDAKDSAYRGWESLGVAGHSLGHYLSAISMHHRATGERWCRERVDHIVDELAICQAANGDGYLAAIPDGRSIFEDIARGEIRVSIFDLNGGRIPWYTMDKILGGLRDAFRFAGNGQALDVAVGLCDWMHRTTVGLSDSQWQRMLTCEFGAMSHTLADLYALTGRFRFIEMAEKFVHRAVMQPLAECRDELDGLHANTQIAKVLGAGRSYELGGDESCRTMARYFWRRVVDHHTYANGGNSAGEFFGPPGILSQRLTDTTETCNTYNMLRLTRHLFSWEPSGELMDFYERALLNHILASQHPRTGMVKYKGFLDRPARKYFSDATVSWWCCVGTGLENHAKYGESIYFHSGASLYVNLFIASELAWPEMGVNVRQETGFPLEAGTRLRFSCDRPVALTLLVREPGWCEDAEISLNGRRVETPDRRAGFYEIHRTFCDGDVIELDLPMALKIEAMPDDPNRVAFFFGPVMLGADLQGETAIPSLVGPHRELLKALKPVEGAPFEFSAVDVGRVTEDGYSYRVDLNLKPHYRMTDSLYSVYLDTIQQDQSRPRLWRRSRALAAVPTRSNFPTFRACRHGP